MKKPFQLNLTAAEKQFLRKQKINITQLPDYAPDEIATILNATTECTKGIHALIEFQNISSFGLGFARELIAQGYYSQEQLKEKNAVAQFEIYNFML